MLKEYLEIVKGLNLDKRITIPQITNRDFWDGLSEDLKKMIVKEGECKQSEAWSVILLSDYRVFYETGNRVFFEDKCFSRRIKLSALVMAECVQNKGEFIKDILDGMYLMMEESSWCHPAHNSHIRDAKQENMPDTEKPVIDLFAAETGAVLGVAEYMLRPVFDEINPMITQHVDSMIRERLIIPYLTEHFWWMGDEENKAINWTVWITQNILLSAFTRPCHALNKDSAAKIIEQALISTDYFIDAYGEDGCCDEGAQYYSHAGLCLYGILKILNDISDGLLGDVFKINKIRNIANYIRKIYADNGYYINFADCAAKAGNRSAREFLFGKACADEPLCAMASDDYRTEEWDERLLTEEHNLWYRVLQAGTHKDLMRYRPEKYHTPEDVFFESVEMMIVRNDKYVLAAKAGNNGDSHNHNDVGSITLYKDGDPFLIDLGAPTYTAKTFSDRRYEIWTMQSVYHNLPTFYDGHETVMELPGEKYAAGDVAFSEERHSLTMDIAPAYGNSKIHSYKREVSLLDDGILLVDEYDGELNGILSFITYDEPTIVKDEKAADGGTSSAVIRVGKTGDICILAYEKAGDITIERCEISDERLKQSWKHDCFRIRIPFLKGKIVVEIH
ncbi:heparinase II/III domain-containing protein [Butyrivibrio sp. WCD3002]|uniref:heparinase II/III domain-containing protein n=1 Tax=Butyrivibrio sp. WCD3002 TaxID=1280676 RepID=UPI00042316D8|nr:heparinase II/III family protein [Butyrivibrio sp. WCD3002]